MNHATKIPQTFGLRFGRIKRLPLWWMPVVLTCAIALAGRSATITGSSVAGAPQSNDGWTVSLYPATVTSLTGPTAAEMQLIKNKYQNWTFNTAANPSTGTFNIMQYTPFAGNTLGAAEFTVLYSDGTKKPNSTYLWVQFANASNWAGRNGLAVDSMYNNYPFYSDYDPDDISTGLTPTSFYSGSGAIWLDSANYPQQNLQNPAGGGKVPTGGNLLMVDEPYATYPTPGQTSSDTFDLYLVNFTWNGEGGDAAGGTVTFLDGMQWGVYIPEPSSGMLLCAGGLALVWARARRRAGFAAKGDA